jgi:hypothetical protein
MAASAVPPQYEAVASGLVVAGGRPRCGTGTRVIDELIAVDLQEGVDVSGRRRGIRRDRWEDGPVGTQV